jgi:hypothetical protein
VPVLTRRDDRLGFVCVQHQHARCPLFWTFFLCVAARAARPPVHGRSPLSTLTLTLTLTLILILT